MVGVELNSSGWEAIVCPYVKRPHGFGHLNGHGGPKDAMEAEDLDAAARVLYERLCPLLGYRFAFTGVEVADWKSPKELTEQLKPNGVLRSFNLDGLVLSADMWERAEKPDGFVPFGESFVWLPIPARL
jgi:hypothetical protein